MRKRILANMRSTNAGSLDARREGFNAWQVALTLLVLVASILIAGAGPAQASKGHKHKAPKYAITMSITGHVSADVDCEAWTSNWVYSGTYYPTVLENLATLDASARTASGTVDWSTNVGCPPVMPEYGSCSVVAESPYPGVHAGDEEATFHKTLGGLRVADFTQFLIYGEPCGTGPKIYAGGGEGTTIVEMQGFIPKSKIGRKAITVPIAGSFNFLDGTEYADGQMNGTLNLTRLGKKK